MPKTFYTEIDIENLAQGGVTSLDVSGDVVITDLAREKARRLGITLVTKNDKPASAPERPYLAKQASPAAAQPAPALASSKSDLHRKVHTAVVAQLGEGVDAKLLDTIIRRVLNNMEIG